jgi:hypothetical protein
MILKQSRIYIEMITYNIFHTLDIFQRNLLLFQMYKMECSGGAPGMLNTESQNINMLKPPATPKNAQATSAETCCRHHHVVAARN